jgi:hypothetical protein
MAYLKNSFQSSAPIRAEHKVITETDPATGTVTLEEWWKDGKRDRADGPAYIERDAVTGTVTHEAWCKGDKLDRADGPALIVRDAATGTVLYEAWWKDCKRIAPPSAAAKVAPTPQS